MSELRQQFETVLAEFGQIAGCSLALDGDNSCRIVFNGDTDAEFAYDVATDRVLAWFEVCRLDDDAADTGLARRLLATAGDPAVSRGCTLALEKDTRTLVVCDWRPAAWLYTADRLAGWLQRLLWFVGDVRDSVAAKGQSSDFHLYDIRV